MPQRPWEELIKGDPLLPCNCGGCGGIKFNTKVYGHGDFGPEIECISCGKTCSTYFYDNGGIEAEWNKLNRS